MEQLARLLDDGGILRDTAGRRSPDATRQRHAAAAIAVRAGPGIAAAFDQGRLRRGRRRRQAWHLVTAGHPGDADQARPAGGLLSDGGTAGTDACGAVKTVVTDRTASRPPLDNRVSRAYFEKWAEL